MLTPAPGCSSAVPPLENNIVVEMASVWWRNTEIQVGGGERSSRSKGECSAFGAKTGYSNSGPIILMLGIKRHDSQNEIRRVSTVLPQKESQDRPTPQLGDVQDARSRREARARSAVFQTWALSCGRAQVPNPQCGRAQIPRKSSRARMMAAMLLARTVR